MLADDWVTAIPEKLAFCKTVNPNCSKITITNGVPSYNSTTTTSPITPTTTSTTKPEKDYKTLFLDLHAKLHDPSNGYFSKEGLPYHSVETLMVEAPDHGSQTTSEALSYYIWNEAMYGNLTGDWTYFKNAWNVIETKMIPTNITSGYNPSKPATYAAEHNNPSDYPSQLETGVPVGNDPIANDIIQKQGSQIYGMHW